MHDDPETQSLSIERSNGVSAETREFVDGLNVDLESAGAAVGIDIGQASRKLGLTEIETTALPLAATAAA